MGRVSIRSVLLPVQEGLASIVLTHSGAARVLQGLCLNLAASLGVGRATWAPAHPAPAGESRGGGMREAVGAAQEEPGGAAGRAGGEALLHSGAPDPALL